MEIAVAAGDGIGPEIMAVVERALDAVNAPITRTRVEMGAEVYERGESSGMTAEARETVERVGLLLKGPMATPKGGGVKSINVTARKLWNTFANKRVFRTLRGVETLHSRSGLRVDLTMIRENIEDTYGAVEHMQTHDVAQCRRFITRPGSEQVHRYAFEVALRKGARRVTCGHKANIMKLTDGLFLETFYEVAKEFPGIVAEDRIVDDLAMQLVTRPDAFEVVVLPNLQGDILSDLCAGLVGGLGYAPSANVGENVCIFEAVHGTAPDIVGKDRANPTALLLSAIMMLRHLGLFDCASHLDNALERTLLEMSRPRDLALPALPFATSRFEQVLLQQIEETKPSAPRAAQEAAEGSPLFPRGERRVAPAMMETPKTAAQETVGVDLFVESTLAPAPLAEALRELAGPRMALTMISNRGTQVWPTGSVFTDLVDHYRVRFERTGGGAVPTGDIFRLAAAVSERARVCSLEVLLELNGAAAFSKAQGQ